VGGHAPSAGANYRLIPLDGALFPPEFPAPQIEWRDPSPNARIWKIEVSAAEGAAPTLRAVSRGEPPKIGEIDQRAVGPTNKLPELTPEQAATHTWRPDPKSWAAIKKQSVERPAIVTIAGYESEDSTRPISQGRVDIRTSTDPIGAPVFYRDVPLMPSKASTESSVRSTNRTSPSSRGGSATSPTRRAASS
jgi:hypothetical protein